MSRSLRPGFRRLGVLAATPLIAASAATALAAPASAAVMPVSPTGSIVVTMRGNGHGHGMSQYGALGAATAGKTYRQIAAFYYPGTTVTTLPRSNIRVRLSTTGTTTTVAATTTLTVTGVSGTLPTTGVSRYRLIADAASGLTLQKLGSAKGSVWTTMKTGLPNRAQFHRNNYASIRTYLSNGTTTAYHGYLRAVRVNPTGAAGGVRTVNLLSLDLYTAGVVPREMPASWPRQATDAQALAARTYGAYAMAHPQNPDYDICDTTQCQVYRGHLIYNAAGALVATDFWRAASDTSNQVLFYKGAVIFSQFSASNGGWTVYGGLPYLPAKVDPYDPAAPGNPYINYKKTVTVPSIAAKFKLAKVTVIAITKRDGHGTWGGRTLVGYVSGTDAANKATTVPFTGFQLQAALGIGTTWLTLSHA
jgi:stage II sporulation protein D